MIAAIVVAAGKGIRMGGAKPKQFLPLGHLPIVVHSLNAFGGCHQIDTIILVAPQTDHSYCREHLFPLVKTDKPLVLANGGVQRQDSVYNGLALLDERKEGIVLIHDGVRPLVSQELIAACIHGAKKQRACIPVVPAMDTLKEIDPNGMIKQTVPRKNVVMAQTPQAFQLSLIKKAHQRARSEGWQATDDASLVERLGVKVHTIKGSRRNIKVTTPSDLIVCQALLDARAP